MTKSIAVALLAMFASGPAVASGWMIPVSPQPGISVVAPEMESLGPREPTCIRAEAAVASRRVPVPAAGAYVPLTKDDNSPWRFNMSQNGKRMTSVEFDAWMKAKGIRVATGKPTVVATPDATMPADSAGSTTSGQ